MIHAHAHNTHTHTRARARAHTHTHTHSLTPLTPSHHPPPSALVPHPSALIKRLRVQYKNNMALGASAQAITAMPDVRVVRLLPTDEFMVLACDGIWEVMTSQEVVDFVRPRIVGRSGDTPLSSICEELCDACVASEDEMNDPESDGTGCDNMTVMIVVFKQDAILRSAATKRAALEKQRSVVEGGGRKHRRSSGTPSPQPYMNSQSSHLLRPKRIRLDSAHLPLDP